MSYGSMKANEVSIVVCANCGHDHPLTQCQTEVAEPFHMGRINIPQICGCDQWQPILKPFAAVTSTPHANGDEHWGWKVVAWAALIALFVWITYGGGQ